MPKTKAATSSAKPSTSKDADHFDTNATEDSHSSDGDALIPCKGKKRPAGQELDDAQLIGAGGDFGNEMQRMLECFGADISKTLSAKKKRIEQFTQGTLKMSSRRVEEIWKSQQTERQKLHDEFKRQVTSVFTQWESDVDKSKDAEEKLLSLFRQQQKLFQQTRVVQGQRLKSLKQLHEEYVTGMSNLKQSHTEQQTDVQAELKKEMSLLQKKILMDTQQQEMASFRKSLHSMLY